MRLQTPEEPTSDPAKCRERLRLIGQYMQEGDVGVELGVFKGSFLDYLLHTNPKRIFAVDPWYRAGPNWDWANADPSTLNALVRILETFSDQINSGILVPRIEYSEEFLRSYPRREINWVYIDTTHTYAQTLLEIELSLAKVVPGGYIMGDDYVSDPSNRHHGVWRAVHEFVSSGHIELVVDGPARQFVAKVLS